MLVRMLSQAGYRYATANNGLEALNAFRTSSFDAILMVASFSTVSSLAYSMKISHSPYLVAQDLQMPVMDGLTATRAIRQMEQASVINRENEASSSCNSILEFGRDSEQQLLGDVVGTCYCPRRHTPIIGVTASISDEDKAICLGVGMDDFVEKPIRRDLFLSVLKGWTEAPD